MGHSKKYCEDHIHCSVKTIFTTHKNGFDSSQSFVWIRFWRSNQLLAVEPYITQSLNFHSILPIPTIKTSSFPPYINTEQTDRCLQFWWCSNSCLFVSLVGRVVPHPTMASCPFLHFSNLHTFIHKNTLIGYTNVSKHISSWTNLLKITGHVEIKPSRKQSNEEGKFRRHHNH